MDNVQTFTAFSGSRRLASGTSAQVLAAIAGLAQDDPSPLVFDDATGQQVELAGPGPAVPRGPGRPKLGVVSREVTLLPRHWEWLSGQPGGASVALRRLVDEARRANEGADRRRKAQETAYRFMSAVAGNEAGFEEAARALFAGDGWRFEASTQPWPHDVAAHARRLAAPAFQA
jgi:hypothetical protein